MIDEIPISFPKLIYISSASLSISKALADYLHELDSACEVYDLMTPVWSMVDAITTYLTPDSAPLDFTDEAIANQLIPNAPEDKNFLPTWQMYLNNSRSLLKMFFGDDILSVLAASFVRHALSTTAESVVILGIMSLDDTKKLTEIVSKRDQLIIDISTGEIVIDTETDLPCVKLKYNGDIKTLYDDLVEYLVK